MMEQTLGSSSEDFLPVPVQGGRGLTTQDRETIDLSGSIPGWGSDLDPNVRPGVPRDKAPEIGGETLYLRNVQQQEPTVRIHKSTEHARLTPVFGTSCPPSRREPSRSHTRVNDRPRPGNPARWPKRSSKRGNVSDVAQMLGSVRFRLTKTRRIRWPFEGRVEKESMCRRSLRARRRIRRVASSTGL